ncbi:MAG: filamentous hemagglutinin N-terminal domain-containing protein [Gammaproteobacteria bacterium]|nr:filamentous hemagglutinin N-terminal domain-containing protein [Gammaproteobacteria bacterium]
MSRKWTSLIAQFDRLDGSKLAFFKTLGSMFLKKSGVLVLTLSMVLTSFSTSVLANPQGGQIEAGNVSMSTPAANTLQINQTSQSAIINWQTFNINAHETTHFQQPQGGVTLNRVNPMQGASEIYGHLTATGRIILVNPAGIYFGPNSFVNVGSLIASTTDISSQNFLAGQYIFNQTSSYAGQIVNAGTIIARDHGLIALVGGSVSNSGHIEANMGTIALGSGSKFTLDLSGDQLISFTVDEQTIHANRNSDGSLKHGVSNTGMIRADGGKVLITAKAAQGVLDRVINLEGVVQAKSVSMRNGEIILSGDPSSGVVRVAANVNASGKSAAQRGGKINVTGHNILIDNGATLDVSGDLAGGEILIGGNYLGKGPLPNANATVIATNTRLIADALHHGDGGTVIVWSNELTKFYGEIFARAGQEGGNGGFVETSSKNNLEAMGSVSASAPAGQAGLWLLDPSNVTISAAATVNGSFDGASPNVFTTTANNAVANVATIVASLNSGTSVTILTTPGGTQTGNITITDAIVKSALNTPTLTLTAVGAIIANNNITSTLGGLNVVFNSDSVTLGSTANSVITTNGGNFTANTANAFAMGTGAITGTINTGSGTVAINANQDGLSSQGFAMGANSSIVTTNTTASAIAINVNAAAGGGTGTAVLRSMTTGNGGTITVATNTGGNITGGSITMGGGILNVGSGTINLTTSQAAARAIGAVATPIPIIAGTLNATTGSSGIFINNTGTTGLDLGTINSTAGLTLTSLGSSSITNSGILTLPGTLTIAAGATQDITLNNAANNLGTLTVTSGRNVSVTDTNALILGASTISGTLDVITNGALTQTGALAVTGLTTLTAGAANSITLSNASNNFSSLSILSGNVVSLRDANALVLAALTTAGNLTVQTGGALTQSGVITSPGIATLIAGAGNDITLTNGANNFATVAVTSGNNVALTDTNALILGASTISGALDVITNGALTQSGALAITGLTTLAAGVANNITLNTSTNNFSTIKVVSGNVVNLRDANALIFDAIAANSLTIQTAGALTQSGIITVPGTTTLIAGATNNITLTNAANDFGTVAVTSGLNVALTDANALSLGASTVSGTLDIITNGALTQSGAVVVTGITTVNSTLNNVVLTTATNNFATFTVTSGNNVSVTDAGTLILGASTISGTLNVITNGALTQTGPLAVTGLTTLTAGAANSITLSNASNDFSSLSIISGNVVSLRDVNALVLAALTTAGSLTVQTGGALTQSGVITSPGTTTLIAGVNNIVLTNANNFGTVAVTSGDNVSLTDTNALILGASTISGTLNVVTNGALTQTGALAVTGLTTLTAGAANSITLSNASNDFSSLSIISGNVVSLRDVNALVLAALTTAGSLTVQTGGALTQSGVITSPGTTTLIAGVADITLTNATNNFATVAVTSGNNVALTDTNALILGASTISGTLDVITNGALTQSGTLAITGLTTLAAGLANNITLNTATNNFSTVKVVSGNVVNLRDANALILDAIAANSLTVQTAGALTQSGVISVPGTTTLIAGATNNITLTNAANDFGTVAVTSGLNVALTDANALSLGASTVSGTLDVITNGALTQSGALSITGLTTLQANLNNITLNNAANNFSTVTVNSASDINLRDTNGIILGSMNPTGSLIVTAGAAITQSGTLTGTSLIAKTLNNAGMAITLNDFTNNFSTIDLRSRNAADTTNAAGVLSYNSANGFDISTIATTNAINLNAGEAITQTGSILGTTLTAKTLKDGGASITLNNPANSLTTLNLQSRNAADTINEAGNISFSDVSGIAIGRIATTALANVTATTITQTGIIEAQELIALTLNNASGAITLTNTGNEVSTVDLRARNATNTANAAGAISYIDASGFDVAAVQTTGAVTLRGNNAITQSGVMSGSTLTASTFNNVGADITFNLANAFTTLNLQSRNVANNANTAGVLIYQDVNALAVAALQTLSNATVITGGAITNTGALIVGDTLTTSSVGGTILSFATNQINKFNATNSGSGAITLVNTAAPLTITGLNQSGGGAVTITNIGTLAVDDGVTINSGDAPLAITATDLNLNTTGALNSGNGALTLTQNTIGGSIGLGNASGTMSISGNELQRMSAGTFNLNTASNGFILVDGVSVADSSQIAGLTTLTATVGTLGYVNFINNPVSFKALTVNTDDGILVGTGASLTTSTGNLTLNANVNGAAGTNDTLALNADLTATGSMSLSAAQGGIVLGQPVNLTSNGLTINDAVSGPHSLNVNAGTGIARFNDTVNVSNLNVQANSIAINASSITTTLDQVYGAVVTLGNNLTMLGRNISLQGGVLGDRNLTLNGQPGDNIFNLAGSYALNQLTVTGSGNGVNTLAIDSVSSERWDITGANQGNIMVTGINDASFINVGHLIGGTKGNTFVLNDGASLSGAIDGNELNAVNTIDYSHYLDPLGTFLANLFYSGDVANNSGTVITHFLNINNLIGNPGSTLYLPTKLNSLHISSPNSGFVSDPLNFSGFTSFATSNSNDPVIFIAPAVYDFATNQLRVDGVLVSMNGFNPSRFSGNITYGNVPVPPVPSIPNFVNLDIANVITPFDTNINPMQLVNNTNVTITNHVADSVSGTSLVFTGREDAVGSSALSPAAQSIRYLHNLFNPNGVTLTDRSTLGFGEVGYSKILNIAEHLKTAIEAPTFSMIIFMMIAFSLGMNMLLRKEKLIELTEVDSRTNGYQGSLPNMSFKLRSALDSIIGFSELIYYGDLGAISDRQKEMLGYVLVESKNMLTHLTQTEALNSMEESVEERSFAQRTMLNSIIGFAKLIDEDDVDSISSIQKDFLRDVIAGSQNILKIIPAN